MQTRSMTALSVLALVGGSIPVSSDAASPVDCADWNSQEYFQAATVEDVAGCLTAGADPKTRDDKYGWTPLHRAAGLSENPAVIVALLDAGANIEARDKDGWTPLHGAARFNESPAVIVALLDAGANPKARDKFDETPWDYIQDNEALKDSDVYWRLNEAQY